MIRRAVQQLLIDQSDAQLAPNPMVLPSEARQCTVRIQAGDTLGHIAMFAGIGLPTELSDTMAVKRQLQYVAARYCAERALSALEPGRSTALLQDGPLLVWPCGVTGSITYTDDFVSVAVARARDAAALAISSQAVMSARRAAHLAAVIAWPCELAAAMGVGFDRLVALTLVSSAKETVFKALHACVGHVFGDNDVRLVDFDARTRTFGARVMKTLSNTLPRNTVVTGHFDIDLPTVHTGLLIRPATPGM